MQKIVVLQNFTFKKYNLIIFMEIYSNNINLKVFYEIEEFRLRKNN